MPNEGRYSNYENFTIGYFMYTVSVSAALNAVKCDQSVHFD